MITNSYILSAVLVKWLNPAIQQFTSCKMSSLPFIRSIETKMKSTGWVSPSWSLASELSPLMNNVSSSVVQPLIQRFIARFPDEAIPKMAHSIVDDAIKNGGLSIFEGKVTFELEDLKELKEYLNYNLPLSSEEEYVVKMKEDTPTVDGDSSAETTTN